MLPKIYTFEQLHEAYGWPVGSLRQWAYSNELPTVKVGRHRYVTEEALQKFLTAREHEGKPLSDEEREARTAKARATRARNAARAKRTRRAGRVKRAA